MAGMALRGRFRGRWRLYLRALGLLFLGNTALFAMTHPVIMAEKPADVMSAFVNGGFWLYVLIFGGAATVFQGVYLFPVRRPALTPRRDTKRRWSIRISLCVAGVSVTVLTSAAALAGMEVLRVYEPWMEWLSGTPMDGWLVVGPVLVLQWLIFGILIVFFVRPARRETLLGRVASAIFLGTSLEVLAIIPLEVLVRRRTDCYCATGTFLALLGSSTVGIIFLGPTVVLALLSRRRRRFYGCRCDVCRHDMRACMDVDQCPACGSGWSAAALYSSDSTCACGHEFGSDVVSPSCPACSATRFVDPLIPQMLACAACGYDMRGDLTAPVCPECGEAWADQSAADSASSSS